MRNVFDINGIRIGGGAPLFLIAGPCVLESNPRNRSCALSIVIPPPRSVL